MPLIPKKLNHKKALFVEEYVKTGVSGASAIKVGYKKDNASVVACSLMKEPLVMEAIAKKKDKLAKKYDVQRGVLIERWKDHAFFSQDDIFKDDGTGKPEMKEWNKIPQRAKNAITEIQVMEMAEGGGTSLKIKFADPQKALRNLGEMAGYYVEQKQITKDVRIVKIQRTIVEAPKRKEIEE